MALVHPENQIETRKPLFFSSKPSMQQRPPHPSPSPPPACVHFLPFASDRMASVCEMRSGERGIWRRCASERCHRGSVAMPALESTRFTLRVARLSGKLWGGEDTRKEAKHGGSESHFVKHVGACKWEA